MTETPKTINAEENKLLKSIPLGNYIILIIIYENPE